MKYEEHSEGNCLFCFVLDAHIRVTLFKEAANSRLMAKCRQRSSAARSLARSFARSTCLSCSIC